MRRFKSRGGFVLTYVLNLVFNAEWSIPAWILLFLHFYVLKISVWWSIGAFVMYFIVSAILSAILCWAASGPKVPLKLGKNKNPYSSSAYTPYNNSANTDNGDNTENGDTTNGINL